MTSAIEIAGADKALPVCTPNLMPFHIDYSGPAPISTFFRAKQVDVSARYGATAPEAAPQKRELYTAAFRGRTVHGLAVPLPEGYGGLVLRADAPGASRVVAPRLRKDVGKTPRGKGVPRRRSTRASAKAIDIDDESGSVEPTQVNDGDDDGALGGEWAGDLESVRVLKPSSTFSSLVMWNPDIPVDEGKDEFIRALKEWTALAAVVHLVEEE